jgi:hypothetical protein
MDIDERILQRHDIAGSRVDLCSICGRAIPPGAGKRIAAGIEGVDDDLVACVECWQAHEVGALPLDADTSAIDPGIDE